MIIFFLQIKTVGDAAPGVTSTIVVLSLGLVLVVFAVYFQVIKVKNFKTLQKVEQKNKENLLKASIESQETERRRISADLHDDAGPLLATVRLYMTERFVDQPKAEQLQTIFSAKQIIDEAIKLIRNISHTLSPPTLKNFGLEVACVDLMDKINNSGRMRASANFLDYKDKLTEENEMLAFRIVQEVVSNILKHSEAGFIQLSQNTEGTGMFIRINHDGRGLTQKNYDYMLFNSKGLGLKNIDNRTRLLGGKISYGYDPSISFYKITLDIPEAAYGDKLRKEKVLE